MIFEKILMDFILSAFAPANAQSRLKTIHRIVFYDVTPCNTLQSPFISDLFFVRL